MSGRECTRCDGRMRAHFVHVHELRRGDVCARPDRPDEFLEVTHVGLTTCKVGKTEPEEREFETATGETVRFTSPGRPKLVAPGMEVIPIMMESRGA